MSYLVYNPEKGKPKTVHTNFEDAIKEAGRLAIKENTDIFVLEVKAKVSPECSFVVSYFANCEEEENGEENKKV